VREKTEKLNNDAKLLIVLNERMTPFFYVRARLLSALFCLAFAVTMLHAKAYF
jgi:hypothetical protein